MSPREKLLSAALLLAIWAALVFTGKAPVDGFITMLRDALLGLGLFTATLSKPKE